MNSSEAKSQRWPVPLCPATRFIANSTIPSAAPAFASTRPNISYEGWARLWHYNQPAIVIYDALRGDGEQLGAVTIDDPEIVERPSSKGTIEEVSMAAISDSPYSVREPNDADHKQFVKLTRERGHLIPLRSSSHRARRYWRREE